jgi:hypothetical protein
MVSGIKIADHETIILLISTGEISTKQTSARSLNGIPALPQAHGDAITPGSNES